jgi:hypothetical protein
MVKKLALFFLAVLMFSSLVYAIDLDVSSKPIVNSVILDLEEPAVFNLTIRNLGENDTFEIYSLVGVDITPGGPFEIKSSETRTIQVEIMPQKSLRFKRELPFPFDYKIRNSKNEIQEESLSIRIVDLQGSFSINADNVNRNSESVNVNIKNELMFNFEKLDIKLDSAFFESQETIALGPLETSILIVPIDKEKLSKLSAGRYLMNTQITARDKKADFETQILFLEQAGVEPSETTEGFFIRRKEFTRKNVGNVKKNVEISNEQNLFSFLFSSVNIKPSLRDITGFSVVSNWEKELIPNEEYKVVISTNWYYPILIIILVIVIIFIVRRTVDTDLQLRKHVGFVKTRGGQFALKITLRIRSKKFLERIRIFDKLPALVKLYDKFGAVSPDHIDVQNRRLEWNIESLNKGEERIFTYIIYSKIGIVGRFELPSASATYEKDGKVKDTSSNRSFFINEPKKD